jgi:transposase
MFIGCSKSLSGDSTCGKALSMNVGRVVGVPVAGLRGSCQCRIAVDTIGLLLTVLITAAGIQDRDAAEPLLWNLRRACPTVRLTWADGGYVGKLITRAEKALKLTVQIVRRPDDLHTFKVLPRRWIVERILAWITRRRRAVRDYELPDVGVIRIIP